MKQIQQDIELIMNSKKNDSLLSFFLYILSQVYISILKIRSVLYDKEILKSAKLPCKVISIGNITAGGTGKTPMTILLAEMLKKQGCR